VRWRGGEQICHDVPEPLLGTFFPWEKSSFKMRSFGTSMTEEKNAREGRSRGDCHGVANFTIPVCYLVGSWYACAEVRSCMSLAVVRNI
jgi:hypothetical protein